MATVLKLGATDYEPISEADTGLANWIDGNFYGKPPLAMEPMETEEEYEEMAYGFFGVPGVATKQGGFRGRDIEAELLFVSSNLSTSRSASALQYALLHPDEITRFSVTMPGGSIRAGCRIKRAGWREVKWFTIGGKLILLVKVSIRQMGSTP